MNIQNDFNLSEVLWYKVGGIAKHFITADTREEVLRALDFVEKNHIKKLFLCGLGSNLIFAQNYFDGAIIQIAEQPESKKGVTVKQDGVVEVFSGTVLGDFIQSSLEEGLTGLEWAGGLPGTVGAGIRGNVGAFGGEIKDTFLNAEVLDLREGGFDIVHLQKDAMDFSYRHSVIKEKKNLLVLSAEFQLYNATDEGLESAKEVCAANKEYRETHHPIEYPTCGSVFKNIVAEEQVNKVLAVWPDVEELVEEKWHGKVSMGYIIKRLGFVGYRIGGMEVSKKHANFIINTGEAKAQDVLTIISHIQERVGETFGFTPEVEVEVIK